MSFNCDINDKWTDFHMALRWANGTKLTKEVMYMGFFVAAGILSTIGLIKIAAGKR